VRVTVCESGLCCCTCVRYLALINSLECGFTMFGEKLNSMETIKGKVSETHTPKHLFQRSAVSSKGGLFVKGSVECSSNSTECFSLS